MDRMKTFLKYGLWIIGFFIFSEILINVGLNSSYKPIKRKDELARITIYQAEATKINGRIRGIIDNKNKDLNGKYLEVDLYSKRDVYLGKKYFELTSDNENVPIELFFKKQDVGSYDLKIVDKKDLNGELELEFLEKDLTKGEIILGLITILVFWG